MENTFYQWKIDGEYVREQGAGIHAGSEMTVAVIIGVYAAKDLADFFNSQIRIIHLDANTPSHGIKAHIGVNNRLAISTVTGQGALELFCLGEDDFL